MRSLSFFFFFLFCAFRSSGQCDSSYLRSMASAIFGLHLFDTLNMIAVGDNGDIIRTADGGEHWSRPSFYNSSTYILRSLHFPTPRVGYAVGDNVLLKTEDAGLSWFPIVPPSPNLYKVFFLDADKGFITAGDGQIFVTTDGGHSWRVSQQYFSENVIGITFTPNGTGFVCGSNRFLARTADEGATWTQIDLGFLSYGGNLTCIKFYNDKLGYAATSGGTVIKTTDGGLSWAELDRISDANFADIYIHDENTAYIVGGYAGGYIQKTVDGGKSWLLPYFTYPGRHATYYAIAADPEKKKIVAAGAGGTAPLGYGGRKIITTTDNGETWSTQSGNFALNYYTAQFINDSTGYIAGEEGLSYKTTDRGESWKPVGTRGFAFNNVGISFPDEQNGFLLNDTLYKTTNGGATWKKLKKPWEGSGYQPYMQFLTPATGFLADANAVYKTVDSGSSWKKVATVRPTSFFVRTGVTFHKNKGYVVGYDGMVIRSSDFGTSWATVSLNTNQFLTSVYFYNDSLGFIGSNDSLIFRTVDGGANWKALKTGIAGLQFTFFKFVSDSTGYMVGNNNGGLSNFYVTKDRGNSWQFLRQESEDLTGVQGFSTVYFIGKRGLLLKTEKLTRPALAGYIAGRDSSCVNATSSYQLPDVPGLNYSWSLSGGGTHHGEAFKDTVSWTQTGVHQLSVVASNACGQTPPRVLPVTIIEYLPSVTKTSDTVLTASPGLHYQWKKDGVLIPGYQGGTKQSLLVRSSGLYAVEVTNNLGCTSLSAPYSHVVTAVGNPAFPGEVLVYPSVTHGKLNIRMQNSLAGTIQMKVFSAAGQVVKEFRKSKSMTSFTGYVTLDGLATGIYFLQLSLKNYRFVHRIVLQ